MSPWKPTTKNYCLLYKGKIVEIGLLYSCYKYFILKLFQQKIFQQFTLYIRDNNIWWTADATISTITFKLITVLIISIDLSFISNPNIMSPWKTTTKYYCLLYKGWIVEISFVEIILV